MIEHLGSKTLGALNKAIPLVLPVLASTLADLLSRIAALQSQITANAAYALSPPDPAQIAAALAGVVSSALASLTDIVLAIPSSLVSASASFSADLGSLLALKVQLLALVELLEGAVSAGGIHAFRVDARASSLGSELAALTSSGMPGGGLPNARVRGIVLLTEDPAAFAALGKVFLT